MKKYGESQLIDTLEDGCRVRATTGVVVLGVHGKVTNVVYLFMNGIKIYSTGKLWNARLADTTAVIRDGMKGINLTTVFVWYAIVQISRIFAPARGIPTTECPRFSCSQFSPYGYASELFT